MANGEILERITKLNDARRGCIRQVRELLIEIEKETCSSCQGDIIKKALAIIKECENPKPPG